jgi:putative flippase GtrA
MDIFAKVDAFLSSIYKDYMKFVKYMGVGVIGTLVDLSVLFILVDFFGVYYLYGNVVSYGAGTVVNFILNKRYTFNNSYKKVHFQFLTFAAVAAVGWLLSEILLYFFVDYLFKDSSSRTVMVSKVIATFIVVVYNYIVNKRTTFKIFQ